MAKNSSSGVCTRHVNTRYHFIQDHIEDSFIQIVFVKSCENDAELFTKYVSKDIYDEQVSKFFRKVNEGLEERI
jgi:hypothetical protein